MQEYLPFILVSAGFILTTLFALYECYNSSKDDSPNGPSSLSGSATPPLRFQSSYAANYGTRSDSPPTIVMEGTAAAPAARRPILRPTFMTERMRESNTLLPARQYKGSMGDQTRRTFYKLLSLALFSRCVFLPYEAYIYYNDTGYHQELLCLETPSCIMARSVPDLAFATSYSLLVVFYAQLAGTASAGGPKGLSLLLSQRGLFGIANAVIYTFYFFMLGLAYLSVIPLLLFEIVNWVLLCALYGSLLFVLTHFGPMLVRLLGPSLTKPSSQGLALRLVAMCLVCTLVFLSRVLCFGLAIIHFDGRYTNGMLPHLMFPPPQATDIVTSEYLDDNVLRRDLFGYALLELLPSLAILLMMHPLSSSSSSQTAAAAAASVLVGEGGSNTAATTTSFLSWPPHITSTASADAALSQESRPLLQQQQQQGAGINTATTAVTNSIRKVLSGGASSHQNAPPSSTLPSTRSASVGGSGLS